MEIPPSEIRHTKKLAFDTCERFRANIDLLQARHLSLRFNPRQLVLVAKFVARVREIAHMCRRPGKSILLSFRVPPWREGISHLKDCVALTITSHFSLCLSPSDHRHRQTAFLDQVVVKLSESEIFTLSIFVTPEQIHDLPFADDVADFLRW